MKKTHICYLISSLCNEGPTNVMYNIIQYLDFDKFDVSIVTLVPEKENSRFQEFSKFPITIYQLSPNRFLNPLKLYSALRKQVKTINPDKLHAHCPRSLYLMCFLPRKYKRVYTIHIYPGLQQQILYGKFKGDIVNTLNHFFTRKCDLPIGCALSVGELYKENKGWNILSIPNGSSLPIWQRNEEEKRKIRTELGIDNSRKYFIFIGRFSNEKNPDFLVEVFNSLEEKNIGLIMLGNGPLWETLKQKAQSNIIIPGFTARVYDYLKAANYYVSASDVEGLANTILESMTVGLPMLLSDIPSHREVLQRFPQNSVGFIFDNKNIEDTHAKINEILQFDAEEATKNIQDVFCDFYTAKVMSEAYQKAYIELFNK
ncbi:MAG: glycosyltransferase [Bacteroidetes bacterium]|nr:glycosyltransferase [Bacteroidota bacterium]